jgi:VIT1/CCC1 family predicted Fe2+/Mn2+ transporter
MFGVKSNFINLEFRTLEEILNDKWISEDAKNKIKEMEREQKEKTNDKKENKILTEYIEEEEERKDV